MLPSADALPDQIQYLVGEYTTDTRLVNSYRALLTVTVLIFRPLDPPSPSLTYQPSELMPM